MACFLENNGKKMLRFVHVSFSNKFKLGYFAHFANCLICAKESLIEHMEIVIVTPKDVNLTLSADDIEGSG